MNSEILASTDAPWLVLVVTTPSEFTDLFWRIRLTQHQEVVAVRVRGGKMKKTESLFDEMAAAFQFPHYFGENWAALEECLCDLDWFPGRLYVLGIQDAQQVLSAEPAMLRVLCDLLVRTCESWAKPVNDGQAWDRPAIPFHVLLQCQAGEEGNLMIQLEDAGIRIGVADSSRLA